LEKKLKELENEIFSLKLENNTLKQIADTVNPNNCEERTNNKFEMLINDEKFAYIKLPEMLQSEPDKVRFTMIDQSIEIVGAYGKQRIKFIKELFKTILDNILSMESKALFACFSTIDLEEWGEKVLKPRKRECKKYMKTKEEEKEEVKMEDIAFQYEFSEASLKYWIKNGGKFMKAYEQLKDNIHDLIRIRNKIFNSLRSK
jgi:hypothetical protein